MDTHAPAAKSEFETEILDAIEKWLARDVRPHVLKFDHADEYPHDMVEQMKALGLFGATIPQEYGGLGSRRLPKAGCRSRGSSIPT
jgi:alkylation response protein AidB-like acyl-CoA dehydrogenase